MDRPAEPKDPSGSPDPQGTRFHPGSFIELVIGLGAQAHIFLGILDNPITLKREEIDLDRARHVIGTIEMLEEKTEGNLTRDESEYLKRILADLRLRWVQASEGKPLPSEE